MHRIVILGGGTGGTLTANRLRKVYSPDAATITVVDQNNDHVYQPGLLFVPFGLTHPEDIVRPRGRQLHKGIDYRISAVERVDVAGNLVHLGDGSELSYDVLVVATGAVLSPGETEGLTGPGWNENVFTFYEPHGAAALEERLTWFDGGRLVVNVVDMPIKCPVAPLEFCFLADWFFREKGIRDKVDMTYVTPLDSAFTKPVAAKQLGAMLSERNIELVTEFNTGEVDGAGGRLVSFDGREVPFDLAVVIPVHSGASYVARSEGLGDELGFVMTDEHTLQSKAAPNVFAIGDATSLPVSKAGSVTHFEGEVLVDNICRFLAGEPLRAAYDGHANCFIETGFSKAMLIDFNYDVEPLTGHFPTKVGLPLLKESRLNHLGKLMFQWFYWHGLLPGRDIPGIHGDMPMAGKVIPSDTNKLERAS
ncbi:MAG TPA: FAD/NAD(P)-binding oxidoreductase [Acidimicrobiales bacterium]|nr:FAD/NAD(P)-binding oxidoreductase [Acidimicrobiales bacterium]